MLTTFTVYLRIDGVDRAAFEPIMCVNRDVMSRAREVLQRHPECESVDVYMGDSELFQLKQAPAARTQPTSRPPTP